MNNTKINPNLPSPYRTGSFLIYATQSVRIFSLAKTAESGVAPAAVQEVSVRTAKTEQTATRMPGVVYHRFPTPDHCPPFEMLQPFVDLFRQIDPNRDRVHFHCHGGDGRTSTFLALYDMAYWFTNWKTDRFPTLDGFANRQCNLFDYSLNPAHDCEGKKVTPDWKYKLAEIRWFVLGFMRWYILNGLLQSNESFVLPDDWKAKALEA